ncbi:hypothetical protein K432DRAFT_447772 [Lepidopterella palustris CBS 459.81]|uniref:Heterokaryon incompatibility domain-containing protein n=1 Tax=Lepidopterella palustris CBS 459.81 TaxID=1314670 RepID=A0A8E2DXK5_9PEZI|nr:hypothetical protein K432DRAFT_447772 [Lepidopterella palustris CBS 459.81]
MAEAKPPAVDIDLVIRLARSLILGCTTPFFLDGSLTLRGKILFIAYISFGKDGLIAWTGLRSLVLWVLIRFSSSLFSFFGIWYFLRLIPWMKRHVQGSVTDFDYLRKTSFVELEITLYFAPSIITYVLRVLWTNPFYPTLAFGTSYAVWSLLPRRQRTIYLSNTVGKVVAMFCTQWHNLTIGEIFMLFNDTIGRSFHHWEIQIAQQRSRTNTQGLSLYTYQKLKPRHIRLLRLSRRSLFRPPQCELIQVDLDDPPQYEAISYHWGLKEPDIPLKISESFVLVTAAVDELLHHQRSIFGAKHFWIDAICINQTDPDDEKAAQIPMMLDIYRRASRVLVWLGAPPISTKEIRLLRRIMTILGLGSSQIAPPTVSNQDAVDGLFTKEARALACQSLYRFFQHPWFERIWVVQEVAAGKEVRVTYGGICMDWSTLASAAGTIKLDPELQRHIIYHMHFKASDQASHARARTEDLTEWYSFWSNPKFMDVVREHLHNDMPLPLMDLLNLSTNFRSSVARDKIYALLGIASDGNKLPFKPSYIEPEDVIFIQTASFLLSQETWFKSLSISGKGCRLLFPTGRSTKQYSLPSWVPDYGAIQEGGSRLNIKENVQARDLTGKVGFFANDIRTIQLQAVIFDSILHLGPEFSPRRHLRTLPDHNASEEKVIEQVSQFLTAIRQPLRAWYVTSQNLARQYCSTSVATQGSVDNMFWELCMSYSPEDEQKTGFSASLLSSPVARQVFEFFLLTESSTLLQRVEPICGVPVLEASFLHMYLTHRLSLGVLERAFCITANGSLALVPPLSRRADVLVHVRGGYMPGVFRRTAAQVKTAEWIGLLPSTATASTISTTIISVTTVITTSTTTSVDVDIANKVKRALPSKLPVTNTVTTGSPTAIVITNTMLCTTTAVVATSVQVDVTTVKEISLTTTTYEGYS